MKLFRLFTANKQPTRKRGRLVLPPDEYQELLRRIFRRDKYNCRSCQLRRPLHAHHVKYRSQGGDDAEWNLLSLCERCHEAEHNGYLVILGPNGEETGLDCNGPLRMIAIRGWVHGDRIKPKKVKQSA